MDAGSPVGMNPKQRLTIEFACSQIHPVALGIATGTVFGISLCLMTLWLLFKGGPVIGPTLSLLGQYYPGYTVTFPGAFIGLVYGWMTGFVLGWSLARTRNGLWGLYLRHIKSRMEIQEASRFFDHW